MNAGAPRRTPLFEAHLAANARMTEFAGWAMPVRYGSQIDEHHAVRKSVGMFDVSHMTVVDFRGAGEGEVRSGIFPPRWGTVSASRECRRPPPARSASSSGAAKARSDSQTALHRKEEITAGFRTDT